MVKMDILRDLQRYSVKCGRAGGLYLKSVIYTHYTKTLVAEKVGLLEGSSYVYSWNARRGASCCAITMTKDDDKTKTRPSRRWPLTDDRDLTNLRYDSITCLRYLVCGVGTRLGNNRWRNMYEHSNSFVYLWRTRWHQRLRCQSLERFGIIVITRKVDLADGIWARGSDRGSCKRISLLRYYLSKFGYGVTTLRGCSKRRDFRRTVLRDFDDSTSLVSFVERVVCTSCNDVELMRKK